MEALLSEGLSRLGITPDAAQARQLEIYCSELAMWNGKYGLVNAEGDDIVIRHFLDSLAAVPMLRKMSFDTACDVGSGGGFPGLVLAVMFPDRKFTLIERSGRKCNFLSNTAIMMRCSNVEVQNMDADLIEKRFDLVLFRALGKFNEYFPVLYKLCSENGRLFAFKGKRSEIDKEIFTIKKIYKDINIEIKPVSVPFLQEERHFVIIN